MPAKMGTADANDHAARLQTAPAARVGAYSAAFDDTLELQELAGWRASRRIIPRIFKAWWGSR